MYAANHRINNQASFKEVYVDKYDYSKKNKSYVELVNVNRLY